MIDTEALKEFIGQRLEGTDYFPVDLKVSADNNIQVEIDSMGSVDIDFCVELTRAIEEAFPRDDEDYELEVGSAGITSPFKVRKQWEKNVGNPIVVLTTDGRKLKGTLASVDADTFTLRTTAKRRVEGSKRPVEATEDQVIPYTQVKRAEYDLVF